MIEIQSSRHNDIMIIQLAGRLDAMTAPECEKAIDDILNKNERHLVLDLARLGYVSSAGLRVILKAAKALYGTGHLALARPQENVLEVLEMTGFGEIMPIYASLEEALAGEDPLS